MASSRFLLLGLLLLAPSLASGAAATTPVPDPYQPVPYVRLTHPEWSRNATIYQLNTRQFTPEGTFRAAEKQLTDCATDFCVANGPAYGKGFNLVSADVRKHLGDAQKLFSTLEKIF